MTRKVIGPGLCLGLALSLVQAVFVQPLVAESVGTDPKSLAIRHRDEAGGWRVAETANFRIWHRLPQSLADRVARAAEKAQADVGARWFGSRDRDWQLRCDLTVYPTAADFSAATGIPGAVPGLSRSRCEAGRVVSRRIDLHADAPNWLAAVLPHEVAHVVLAGAFGDERVPPWANEGVAVLTEPRSRVELHLRNLPRYEQADELFPVADLLERDDYPERRRLGPFYAESVSLVEFLASARDPETFTRFVRDGVRHGYASALRKHYGWDLAELERRWRRYAFDRPAP
jgi:hypothetical protein